MEIAGVVERVGRISAVRADPSADADVVQSALVAIREVQAWCDAQHAGLVARLQAVDSFPEQRIAAASKTSLGQAARSTERSTTLATTPQLAEALDDGAITADHVENSPCASPTAPSTPPDPPTDEPPPDPHGSGTTTTDGNDSTLGDGRGEIVDELVAGDADELPRIEADLCRA